MNNKERWLQKKDSFTLILKSLRIQNKKELMVIYIVVAEKYKMNIQRSFNRYQNKYTWNLVDLNKYKRRLGEIIIGMRHYNNSNHFIILYNTF